MTPDEAAMAIARTVHAIQVMQGTGIIDLPQLLRILKGQS